MMPEPDQSAPSDSMSSSANISLQPALELTPAELLAYGRCLSPDERLWLIAAVWGSLPASHPAAPSADNRSKLQRYLDDYEERPTERFPWEVVQELMAGESRAKPTKVYSVPRRFDLATIFVVTFAYSILFGLMKAISFPPTASAVVAGFIFIVAIAQALLFGGKQPRAASIISGALIYTLIMAGSWIVFRPPFYSAWQLLISASFTIAGGAMLGYLAGVVVGGVFLVADKLRNRLSRKPAERNPDASARTPGTTDRGNDPWTS
jgi:putative addiction module component (TIGR02574 family)